ncbi:hypothetical protein LCGC14_1682230 [marine sediment metagenome]|uniref:Uncharacterized protein n=1 Tax=marine sediment metagenome TaxID=412755 RepID=A0A0F9K3S7_9ZZZZ
MLVTQYTYPLAEEEYGIGRTAKRTALRIRLAKLEVIREMTTQYGNFMDTALSWYDRPPCCLGYMIGCYDNITQMAIQNDPVNFSD